LLSCKPVARPHGPCGSQPGAADAKWLQLPAYCYLPVMWRDQGAISGIHSSGITHPAAGEPMPSTASLDTPFAAPHEAIAVCWIALVSHRKDLIRFAQRRLHDPMLAEDVVHDVFEAVLSGKAAFAGRSALRSWLTGILKNKIVDLVRQRTGVDSLEEQTDEDGAMAIACPQPGPHEVAEQRQLLARTLERIDNLPAALRDVMQLRVLQDETTETVCRQLAISPDNLFVRLHRARAQLAH